LSLLLLREGLFEPGEVFLVLSHELGAFLLGFGHFVLPVELFLSLAEHPFLLLLKSLLLGLHCLSQLTLEDLLLFVLHILDFASSVLRHLLLLIMLILVELLEVLLGRLLRFGLLLFDVGSDLLVVASLLDDLLQRSLPLVMLTGLKGML